MKPIGKYILITQLDEEIKTNSGLLLSAEDANLLRYKKGIIIAKGSDVDKVDEKDVIFYDVRAGYTMLIENIPYTIIQEKDVVVVL
tara:strand:+ start:1043 stop:1300 length:258 start_codon:yes stop_codon:yes gene_type:complete